MAISQVDLSRILSDLIAFPSVSTRSNLGIAAYIEAYLADYGIACIKLPSSAEPKTSLLATIGPPDRKGIMISAHMDVVPVEGQDWQSDPFRSEIRNGRLYGRGACDMKGFLAVVLAHVPVFSKAARAMPVHLAFSYDEELGCLGAPDLVKAAAGLPQPPGLCLVGEPTQMKVVRAHKGKIGQRIVIKGVGGHSAFPDRAVNAVNAAIRIASGLLELDQRIETGGQRDPAFDPPRTTIHIGALHGGTALNLVPDQAILDYEIRYLPREGSASLIDNISQMIAMEKARLNQSSLAASLELLSLMDYPGLDLPPEHPAVSAIGRLAGDPAPGSTASFGTEAGIFQQYGIPSLICGLGDIARAHKADEWIGLDELMAASEMMMRLAAQLSTPFDEWLK